MSDEDWDGKERRRPHPICKLNFDTIEKQTQERFRVIEIRLDEMHETSGETARLTQDIRAKLYNGYSDALNNFKDGLTQLEKKVQWLINLFVTSVLGVLSAVIIYLVTK